MPSAAPSDNLQLYSMFSSSIALPFHSEVTSNAYLPSLSRLTDGFSILSTGAVPPSNTVTAHVASAPSAAAVTVVLPSFRVLILPPSTVATLSSELVHTSALVTFSAVAVSVYPS